MGTARAHGRGRGPNVERGWSSQRRFLAALLSNKERHRLAYLLLSLLRPALRGAIRNQRRRDQIVQVAYGRRGRRGVLQHPAVQFGSPVKIGSKNFRGWH